MGARVKDLILVISTTISIVSMGIAYDYKHRAHRSIEAGREASEVAKDCLEELNYWRQETECYRDMYHINYLRIRQYITDEQIQRMEKN
jgi:hypothetical protein